MRTVTNESIIKGKSMNIYKTVVLISLRARQLAMGAKPMIETKHTNQTLIALEEIKQGKLKYNIKS
ncbi:MAG: DNA-directed RNA polymerase subunit omega [Candidatus Ancaeobacter aquaticus]|nr:DNA-directed RNA polymerase subunit omega [Candidatus Ancaeobacter aquaticus]